MGYRFPPYDHHRLVARANRHDHADCGAEGWQGDFDYTTQPDQSERTNAANWKLSGYTSLDTGSAAMAEVKQEISSGLPVVASFAVHQSWMNISAENWAPQVT